MNNENSFPASYRKINSGAENKANEMMSKIKNISDETGKRRNTYYISSNASFDSTGTSADKPATLKRLSEINLRSGDSVLFERNSIFRVSEALPIRGGVYYGAYGTGEKPVILGSLKNYADRDLWIKSSKSLPIWSLQLKTHIAGVITFNNDSLIGVRKYDIDSLCMNGDYYHDTEKGVFYLYCTAGNPGIYFDDIEIGTTDDLVFAQNVNDIRIENFVLKYASVFAINLGNNRGVLINGCEISYIGGHTFKNEIRYGNGIQFWLRCENITVSNCHIYQIYDAALTFQGCGEENACFENIVFTNNLIEYSSMNFEYWAGTGDGKNCSIKNVKFTSNIIRCGGYGWGGIQRPDKGNQALFLGWNRHYEDFDEFVVSDNIFDCSDGNLIFAQSPSQQPGLIVTGNTYYQTKPTGINPYIDIVRSSGILPDGQESLEKAIISFDSRPRLIKWID